MRPLTLHASALSDAEYDLYTASLKDLADDHPVGGDRSNDDAYYNSLRVGVREARGWLRGRYADVVPADIDAILRMFAPGMGHGDTLTGGEVFAALRLVGHAKSGRGVERGLAFVQADPGGGAVRSEIPTRAPDSNPLSTPQETNSITKANHQPAHPAHHQAHNPTTNPFSVHASPHPPQHPLQRPVNPPHTSHNPFVVRPRQEGGPTQTPPLPPRKPPVLLPPPKHNSILLPTSGRKSVSPTRPPIPPVKPASLLGSKAAPAPPTKPGHITSTLMKQSLQASKAGQTMKRAEEQLEQERVLQVLKSSAPASGTRSTSPAKPPSADGVALSSSSGGDSRAPPLPRRRPHHQQQPSPPVSVSSLEQVALASAPNAPPPKPVNVRANTTPYPYSGQNQNRDQQNNPYHQRPLPDPVPERPPPMHPDRKTGPFPYSAPSSAFHSFPAQTPAPTSPFRSSPFLSHPHTRSHSPTNDDPFFHPPRSRSPSPSPFSPSPSPFSPTFSQNASTPGQYYTPDSSPTMRTFSPTASTFQSSPTARVFRSKSLHHPSPPLPPPPPPARKRRPESVQVLSGGIAHEPGPGTPTGGWANARWSGTSAGNGGTAAGTSAGATLSRHTSLSAPAHRRSSLSVSSSSAAHAHTEGESPLRALAATLQPRLESLQPKFEARLEKARFKAEAGLSKRGYVRDRRRSGSGKEEEEGEGYLLQRGRGGLERERDRGVYDPPSVDGSEERAEGDGEWRERWAEREREELKWPAGEGWKKL